MEGNKINSCLYTNIKVINEVKDIKAIPHAY